METGVGGASFEKVGLGKTVTVGGIYAQNVVGAMETGVGGASLEKVGLSKTVVVGKALVMEAGALLELKCGSSTITMTPGSISISSATVSISPSCCKSG
jgi:type VI secretion system secreted protein VgrG